MVEIDFLDTLCAAIKAVIGTINMIIAIVINMTFVGNKKINPVSNNISDCNIIAKLNISPTNKANNVDAKTIDKLSMTNIQITSFFYKHREWTLCFLWAIVTKSYTKQIKIS